MPNDCDKLVAAVVDILPKEVVDKYARAHIICVHIEQLIAVEVKRQLKEARVDKLR